MDLMFTRAKGLKAKPCPP